MALMKCDKSTEPTLLTHRAPKIGLVMNHVVPHWVKWLWWHKSAQCLVCWPALLGRDAPGRERERGGWQGEESEKWRLRDAQRNRGKDWTKEGRSIKVGGVPGARSSAMSGGPTVQWNEKGSVHLSKPKRGLRRWESLSRILPSLLPPPSSSKPLLTYILPWDKSGSANQTHHL